MLMNSERSLISNKGAAWLWLLVLVIAGIVAVTGLLRTGVESDILALMPEDAKESRVNDVNRRFVRQIENEVVFALKAPAEVRNRFVADLQTSGVVKRVLGAVGKEQEKEFFSLLSKHRAALIGAQTEKRLFSEDGREQRRWVIAKLFSPFEAVSAAELKYDPLLIARSARYEAMSENPVTVSDGWMILSDKAGHRYWFIACELNAEHQVSETVRILKRIRDGVSSLSADIELLSEGVIYYAEKAQSSAVSDISRLGSMSILGLFLIFWLAFRSLRPFVLCVISLAAGTLVAVAVTMTVFGGLHMATLVMSISLVGLSADYTTYFIVDRMRHGSAESVWVTRNRLLGALAHAALTTSAAYLVMVFAPMPGLRQFALFSASGLLAACVTVLLWHPLLLKRFHARALPSGNALQTWIDCVTHKKGQWAIAGMVMAVIACGLPQVTISDDVSDLQTMDVSLQREEARMTELLGRDMTQQWFVITAADSEDLLERTEALSAKLQDLKGARVVTKFEALSIGSIKKQERLAKRMVEVEKSMVSDLAAMGIHVDAGKEIEPLHLSDALAYSVFSAYRLRLFTLETGEHAYVMPVVTANTSAMQSLAETMPGVYWYQRKATFTRVFSEIRTLISKLLFVSLGLVGLLFMQGFGLRKTLAALFACAGSILFAIAFTALMGIRFNLFSLFALIVVLGIGIDYVIFFARLSNERLQVTFAVSVAMVTTLMSLGVLALSSTAAVASFGWMLLSGVIAAFLLAPLVWMVRR